MINVALEILPDISDEINTNFRSVYSYMLDQQQQLKKSEPNLFVRPVHESDQRTVLLKLAWIFIFRAAAHQYSTSKVNSVMQFPFKSLKRNTENTLDSEIDVALHTFINFYRKISGSDFRKNDLFAKIRQENE